MSGTQSEHRVKPGPRRGFRWDKTTICYAIELWHRRTSRTPALIEWRNAGADHPSTFTVLRVFGSWNAAIKAAGFRPRNRGSHKSSRAAQWDQASIIQALINWHDHNGRSPKQAEWRSRDPYRPSASTVVRVFGRWNAGIEAAGLIPYSRSSDGKRSRHSRSATKRRNTHVGSGDGPLS
jgi:hypothetical protein